MQLRNGVLLCAIAMAGILAGGCATGAGGASGAAAETFMQQCTANARTEQERSACAWENASRMAAGGP